MNYNLTNRQSDFRNDFKEYAEQLKKLKDGGEEIDREALFQELQKDARLGMHYTPNQFAALISNSINETPKTILDPCCGLGNILFYLSHSFDDAEITGYEINDKVATITQLLIPDAHIQATDSLNYENNAKYDLIVGNIPLGMRLKVGRKSMFSEEAFSLKALELLNDNGEAFLIASGSLLSTPRMQETRGRIQPYIKSILRLPTPQNSFTNINRYLIHLSAHQSNKVSFGIVEKFEDLKSKLNENLSLTLNKSELIDRLNPEFYFSKNSSNYDFLDVFDTKKLSALTGIIRGAYIKKENKKESGKYLVLKPTEIKDNEIKPNERSRYITSLNNPKIEKCIARPGDILLSTMFNQEKIYTVRPNDVPMVVSNNLVILRGPENDYLQVYFKTETGKEIFNTQAKDLSVGSVIPNITLSGLRDIDIPIFPLDDLNQLGDDAIEKSSEEQLENLKEQVLFYKEQLVVKNKEIEEYKSHKEYLDNRFDKIETQLNKVNKKLDSILVVLNNLKDDFDKIKATNRDDEEKIFSLLNSLDRRIKTVLDEKRETIEEFELLTKRWLNLWDELHPASQQFLPLAEYLYNELCGIRDADFSPFILQYCRTLENEILSKLFQKYHQEGLKDVDTQQLVAYDLDNDTKANLFARRVKANNSRYSLGDMQRILCYLKPNGNTLKKSTLLQHFRAFVMTYFQEDLTKAEFLKQVQIIQDNYRNKAAHVSSLDLKSADECRNLLRDCLNDFLEMQIKT